MKGALAFPSWRKEGIAAKTRRMWATAKVRTDYLETSKFCITNLGSKDWQQTAKDLEKSSESKCGL